MAEERSEDLKKADVSTTGIDSLAPVSTDLDIVAADNDHDRGSTDETERIKDRIEDTRAQMGETIDAIQERLSFSNISEQVSEHVNQAVETAKGAVYDATIGKAVIIMKNLGNEISTSSIANTVKNNPVPFMLIGAGAGMLAYQALSGPSGGRSKGRSTNLSRQGNGEELSSSAINGISDTVGGALGGVKETVTSAAGTAYDKVSGAVDQVYSKAGEYGSTAKEQYDHYLEENPLAVGAVALALGAAVGLAIPATRYEGKLMGQAKRDLLNKAQDTATSLLHESREAVGEASRDFADRASSSVEH